MPCGHCTWKKKTISARPSKRPFPTLCHHIAIFPPLLAASPSSPSYEKDDKPHTIWPPLRCSIKLALEWPTWALQGEHRGICLYWLLPQKNRGVSLMGCGCIKQPCEGQRFSPLPQNRSNSSKEIHLSAESDYEAVTVLRHLPVYTKRIMLWIERL